jgi:Dolichyl-phosphate-mannose-protein mannosyltransferase
MPTATSPLAHSPVRPVQAPDPTVRNQPRSATVQRALGWSRLLPVAAVLAVQASLSLRLMHSNTAFLDEATYLGAGHQLMDRWMHGGPNLNYETYFSGAPVIYPVLAALVDGVGGVLAARYLSLAFMLLATVLAYAAGRRLFGTPAGWFAAAAFATVEGTPFLGAFATYDAMALSLTTVACWIVVRLATADRSSPHAGLFLAAPVMALANATKYATAAYDAALIGVALLVVASRYGWRQGTRVAAMLAGLTAALLAALLALSGSRYLTGVTTTTLARADGITPPGVVRHESIAWVGALAVLAMSAVVVATIAARRRRGHWADVALLAVLALTVLLAPVNHMRIHTSISLSKHVDFGAWFGALASGYQLQAIAGRGWRTLWRYPIAAAILLPMGAAGVHQAQRLYSQWPDSSAFVATLRPLVLGTDGPVLVDDAQVPAYYMGSAVYPTRWINTFYLKYRDPRTGRDLVGPAGYSAAVRDGYFSIIALDFGAQKSVDAAVGRAIHRYRRYRYVTKVELHDVYGRVTYVIWRRR